MLFTPALPDGVRYLPKALASSPADSVLAALLTEVPWQERAISVYGREHLQPRLVALMADRPELSYTYSKKTMPPGPWTPTVAKLKELAEQHAGSAFNTCLLNHYRDGKDSMGWHADAEPELGPEPVIAAWSFGATRTFCFRRKDKSADGITIELSHGDLLIMGGRSQADWLHALPRRLRVSKPRISLTFRYLTPLLAKEEPIGFLLPRKE